MPEINTLLADVIRIARDAAIKPYGENGQSVHYVTKHIIENVINLGKIAAARSKSRSGEEHEQGFQAITTGIDRLSEGSINQLSRLVALETMTTNAVGSAERAASLSSPKEQIEEFLTTYLAGSDRNNAIKKLAEKLHGTGEGSDKLLLSFTHTMHPTIYHTPEARKFEAALTRILESKEYLLLGPTPRLNEKGQEAVKALFEDFIGKLAQGNANISPKRPTTVSVETQAEKENLDIIRKELKNVIDAWNAAVSELKLPEMLAISAERAHEMLEFRTWGQSADADGREKSTSQFLYECIQNNLKNYADVASDPGKRDILDPIRRQQGSDKIKVYDGFTMDARQNAKEVHLPLMDALIQVKYRNSKNGRYGEGPEFADFCARFLEANQEVYGISDPEEFRFTMMKGFDENLPLEDDRTQFVSDIIRNNYRLIPEQIGIDALEFNEKIYPLKKQFLQKYAEQVCAAGYHPDMIDYMEMIHVDVPHPQTGENISLRGLWDATMRASGWELSNNGLQCERLETSGEFATAQHIQVKNFLQGCNMLKNGTAAKNGTPFQVSSDYESIPLEKRATFTDTAKRLFVLNDAIDKYGQKVATRHQIANFSEPSDFMILLKLFQDTGIANIENGVVKSSKLAIQPLLETGEDLAHAPKIFATLLKNPIARSFWKARGNEAEFMIGHSDGSASVGNFASEWAIYKATQELTALFEKEGINVRFFHGRGRGVNRGGTIDPSLHAKLLSPEETNRGIYDVTLQSDLPTDLAASQAYGKDYFTKILLSTLDASITAEQRMSPEEKVRLASLEKAIGNMAKRSGELYEQFVRNNPEVLKFFNNTSDNPYKTSRNASRDGSAKVQTSFDKIRAIPKEYLSNSIDVPIGNIGLRQATDEHEAAPGHLPLAALTKHAFFDAITQIISAGMANYDPTIAKAHGRITKSQEFVEKAAIPQLDGLVEKLARLAQESGAIDRAMKKNSSPGRPNQVSFNPPSRSGILDQIAHGIIIASIDKGMNPKPNPRRSGQAMAADTLFNALFTTAQEIRNVQLPWRPVESQQTLVI